MLIIKKIILLIKHLKNFMKIMIPKKKTNKQTLTIVYVDCKIRKYDKYVILCY